MSTTVSHSTPLQIAPRQQTKRRELLLVLPFLLLFLVQLAHHQMWRDELNAWGIAVASSGPKSLYQHIRYEGHPSLWYIVLWFASRFTASPVAMKCVQALIGISLYLMIALRSPFSRLEKLLLYAGYFISFEYTVMSRMYGLCLLLTLIYAYRRSRYPRDFTLNAALLALIANTDVSGLILSAALLAEYAFSSFAAWKQGGISPRQIWSSLSVYLAGVFFTLVCLRISPHISWRTTGRMFIHARDPIHVLQAVVSYITVPWFPIDDRFPHHFWNPWIYAPLAHPGLLLMTPVIAGMYIWIFRREWMLGLILLLTASGAIVFAHLIYMGGTRHYGVTFTAFLAALWLQRYRRPQFSIPVLLLLLFGATAGLEAAIGQWDHPFSNGRAVVAWLREHGLDKAPLVGTPDTSVAGIAEQLERSIYFLDCNCADTYLLFSNRRDDFDARQTPERLLLASRKLQARDMTFITTYPLPPERIEAIRDIGFSINLAATFTGAEDLEENYYIYRVKLK